MKLKTMLAVILMFVLIGCSNIHFDSTSTVPEFLTKLDALETDGDFVTKEAAMSVASDLPVLLSVTQDDWDRWVLDQKQKPEDCDIYPLAALSAVLNENKQCRKYVLQHFENIQHPDLKFTWGLFFLNENVQNPNITKYMRVMLDLEQLTPWMISATNDLACPDWETIRNRIYK